MFELKKTLDIMIKSILIRKLALFSIILSGYSMEAQLVDPDTRYQTIEGWGTSLSWWANIVGNYPDSVINELSTELTDSAELNMNIFRYNIHGGDNPSDHSGTSANHFRWDSGTITSYKPSQVSAYNWNANSAQRKILLELLESNPDLILEAIAYSPPYWMTLSQCSAGGENYDANLDPNYTDDFADFITDVVQYYHDSLDVTFRTLTALNEPSSHHWIEGGSQEGCRVDVEQQMDLINYLYSNLLSKSIDNYCSISAPEEVGYNTTLSTLNGYQYGDSIYHKIGQINTHGYYQSNRSGVSTYAHKNSLPLWQSEAGPLSVSDSNYWYGIKNHLVVATYIIGDLKFANVNAWIDWQAASTDDRWGLYTYDTTNQVLEKSKNYFVRKQFSKYLKPGYQIIYSGDLNTVAALSPSDDELVIVHVNNSSTSADLDLDLSRFSSVGSSAQVIRTSSTEDAESLASLSLANNAIDYSAPSHSITTFIIDVSVGTGTSTLSEGLYKIKAKHSEKFMSVAGVSMSNGAIIEQWEDVTADNLMFEVRKEGLDYIMQPRYNNKRLTISGASFANGAELTQYSEVGGENQRFIIQSTDSSGYYKIISKHSNLFLAVEEESTANGADVVQWTDLDTDNFYWEFEAVTPTVAVSDGNYYIKAKHSEKYMSVAGWSEDDGAVIEQWEYVDQDNLRFELTIDLSGYYEIRPVYTTKTMTVDGASSTNGAAINIYTGLNAINQKYKIESSGDGYFYIEPKHASGKSLAVDGNSMANGADVVLWSNLGYDNFKWEFESVGSGARKINQQSAFETDQRQKLDVYPNPVNGFVRVSNSENKPMYIRLFDINGELLRAKMVHSSEDINLHNIKPGLYLMKINDGIRIHSHKLIVE